MHQPGSAANHLIGQGRTGTDGGARLPTMVLFGQSTPRPAWLDIGLAFGIAFVVRLVALVGIVGPAGDGGSIVGLVLPAVGGAIAALLSGRGAAVIGTVAGVAIADPLASQIGGPTVATVATALASGAAGIGHAAIFGVRASQQATELAMPKAPSPEEQARVAADLSGQLRAIDPQAPGSFERATVLLRQVNEQLQWFGPMGPWGPSDGSRREAPAELLRVQAALVEAARLSAIAAGARRVTINASGMGGGIDIQAVWGDPIGPGEVLGADADLRPID